MKGALTAICLCIYGLSLAQTTIRNRHLSIAINTKMQTSISTDLAATPLVKGASNSEYLETKYFSVRDFTLSSSDKRPLPTGVEYIFRGTNAANKIEKILSIRIYDQHPE